jgi:polyisoprenoid-binding protein YceI
MKTMKTLRPFIPPLAAMLMAASGGAGAQGVLIDKSEIRFVSKQMGAAVEGRFRKWKANVDFRPKDPAHSRAEFEIELASVDLASEESETELRRASWFDTAKFPVAQFTSSAVKDLGGDRFEISGRLSIKGTTRDVVIPVMLRKDAGGNSVAQGQFTLNRLDYRIGDGQWADTGTVANEVAVRIRMVLPPVN